MGKKISSLLIANRGEIAIRIMRTARALGIRTVAVYSDADRSAMHVRAADEAFPIGAAPPADSYLRIDKIVDVAQTAGVDAIHPGYGFLAENAAFAEAVATAGLVFVGPPPKAIELMGDKAKAKRLMIEAGVPCIPGYQGEDQSDETFLAESKTIGFPLMVKAAAGGGGRGMRVVDDAADLPNALSAARSEASNAFGSGDLILEKAVIRPRHVEVQVFADSHGAAVHLGERDCSVQRRHQKVIEEAPCPVMTHDLREKMGAAAVRAAKAVDYQGAGTVEFLLDASGEFYFLEMNTRIQVEHPVTEAVTGRDLVALQIAVAEGAALGFEQNDVRLCGHAIEARLYAEDPSQNFLPSTGPVRLWRAPTAPGIRIDSGIASKDEISPYYDPMVAKIIAAAETRDAARRLLIDALRNTALFGVATNRAFLIHALERDAFADGAATTAFVEEEFGADGFSPAQPSDIDLAIAAAIQYRLAYEQAALLALDAPAQLFGWSSDTGIASRYAYDRDGEMVDIAIRAKSVEAVIAQIGDREDEIGVTLIDDNSAEIVYAGVRHNVYFSTQSDAEMELSIGARALTVENRAATLSRRAASAGGGAVTAPMHGAVTDVFASQGQVVSKGERLCVLEAMKMQHEILAPIDGVVRTLAAVKGAQAAAGDVLMVIDRQTGEEAQVISHGPSSRFS